MLHFKSLPCAATSVNLQLVSNYLDKLEHSCYYQIVITHHLKNVYQRMIIDLSPRRF